MSTTFLRLYLVRHAEVGERWRGRVYGDLDVELSPRGEDQSARFPERFANVELDAVWSSALERSARPAANLATQRGVPHRIVPDLREVFRGAWRERVWEEVEAELPGVFRSFVQEPSLRPREGESLDDVSRRVRAVLQELRAAHPSGHVALIAHTWVIRALLCDALGLSLSHCDRLAVETASIATVDYRSDGCLVQQINLKDPYPLQP